ncbi:hypothetical protein OSTOST_09467, partial [Ostertagia ostertagi]
MINQQEFRNQKRKSLNLSKRTQAVSNDPSKTHRSKSKTKEPDATKPKKTHGEKVKSNSELKKPKSTKSPLKEKQSKRKEEEERIPTPEPVVQIAETYEDDFEDYTDDFESDDDDENVIGKPNASEQRPVTAVSSSSISSEKTNDLAPQPLSKSSTPPKEELPRIASADRRIDFSSASTIDPNAFTEMNERYRKLRELIVLEPTFYTIVDIPPIKDYDFYMELFGQSGKSQVSSA